MKNFMLLVGMLFSTVLAAAVPEFLVTGEKPIRLETMAEKELCLFYQKIYGKELKKITEKEADGKSVIFLGNTAFARKNGVDPDAAGKEEWILKTVGDDLIISGGRPAGTLYGVYELLERLELFFECCPYSITIQKHRVNVNSKATYLFLIFQIPFYIQ